MRSVAGAPSKRRLNHSSMPNSLKRSGYIFCFIMSIPAIYGIIRYLVINTYSICLGFFDDVPFQSELTIRYFKLFFESLSQQNSEILIALRNTLIFFAISMAQQFLGYVVAYFLYKKVVGHKFARFIFFLPCIIPVVVSVNIFRVLAREDGALWPLFSIIFDNQTPMVNNPLLLIILYVIFFTGIGTSYLIYLGSMKRIPTEILESAKIDGANAWTEFWRFIFPLTWGTFSTFLLMSVAGIFTASGPILFFVDNNLEQAFKLEIQTLGFVIFANVKENGLAGGSYNYASAIGLVLTFATIPLVAITRFISKKIDSDVSF